jgi:hypothetical protein
VNVLEEGEVVLETTMAWKGPQDFFGEDCSRLVEGKKFGRFLLKDGSRMNLE